MHELELVDQLSRSGHVWSLQHVELHLVVVVENGECIRITIDAVPAKHPEHILRSVHVPVVDIRAYLTCIWKPGLLIAKYAVASCWTWCCCSLQNCQSECVQGSLHVCGVLPWRVQSMFCFANVGTHRPPTRSSQSLHVHAHHHSFKSASVFLPLHCKGCLLLVEWWCTACFQSSSDQLLCHEVDPQVSNASPAIQMLFQSPAHSVVTLKKDAHKLLSVAAHRLRQSRQRENMRSSRPRSRC